MTNMPCITCKYCKKTYIGNKEWFLLCRITNEQVYENTIAIWCKNYKEN